MLKRTELIMEMQNSKQSVAIDRAKDILGRLGWLDDPDILGIFIIGSIATGLNDYMSDTDLVVMADPVPSPHVRKRAYQRIGCRKAMINFFNKESPVVKANITAIDKLWIEQTQIDICLCNRDEIYVYNYQPITVIKPCYEISNLDNFDVHQDILPSEIEDRINFCLRILKIHRNRYARWCKRKRWLSIDLSFLLYCARDILLALNGYVHYNANNPVLWNIIESAPVSIPGVSKRLKDIKAMDDRSGSKRKLTIIDDLISELTSLCLSKKITINSNDLE
jgi:hypothetical protein